MIKRAKSDPHQRLAERLLQAAGPNARIESACRRPWASATFLGATHRLELTLEGADAAGRAGELARDLPEMDLPIRGHIVADANVTAIESADAVTRVTIEALTIEDW